MHVSIFTGTTVNKRKRKHEVQNEKSHIKMRRMGINRMFDHPLGHAARIILKEASRKNDDEHQIKG